MNHPDTLSLIRLVEEATGYRVSVEVLTETGEDVRMQSATHQAPVHLILVNQARQDVAPFLVAVQCCMLLVLWSDPSRVPSMVPASDKCNYLADKWAGKRQLSTLPSDSAKKIASSWVQGILHQLSSTPMEIRGSAMCHERCPGLRAMQEAWYTAHLRSLSSILGPEVRRNVPEDLYEKNVGMKAALALSWSISCGNRIALLPYESTGHLKLGEKLMRLLDSATGVGSEAYTAAVDSWAEALSMKNLYRWDYTDRRP
jgi:hypothetical protein